MPELPEVETIRRELIPCVAGTRITGVDLLWPKAVREPSSAEFCRDLPGRHIREIGRRGKYLIFRMSQGALIIHLKMTGVLLLRPGCEEPGKYTTAVFKLHNGTNLHFLDQRKFGALWLVRDETQVVGKLGPEPLEGSFTPALLRQLLGNHRVPVKALLCDQHILAGIGNMWADEALFAARIHPLKLGSVLSDEAIEHLHAGIIAVLEKGIRHKGASTDNYLRPHGEKGSAHTEFKVAHRRGERCLDCGSLLSRITVRGRGTYFCPHCQGES